MNPAKREIVFTFNTTQDAMQSEQKLAEAGISVRVMPLPDSIGAGCGICLRVDPEKARESYALLEKDIAIAAVYTKSVDTGRAVYSPWHP